MRKNYTVILSLFFILIMILSVSVSAPASDKTGEIQGAGKVQTTIPAASCAEGTDAPAAQAFQPGSADRIIDYGVIEPVIEVNPLYADILDPDEIAEWTANEDVSDEPLVGASEPVVATTEEDFALLYRQTFEEMISSHGTSCCVTYEYTQVDPISEKKKDEIRDRIYLIAVQNRFIHSGIPTAGDYARFQYFHISTSSSYYTSSNGSSYTFSYTLKTEIYYYTTVQQEAELTQRLNEVMSELDLDSKTDYEKIKAIYDYIAENVEYDYDNLYDPSYNLTYTAYAALINGKAVCQGYSCLFYRMLLEAGIDARIITGNGGGGTDSNHAWNIVCLKGLYYNMDVTWDAGCTPEYYDFFLRCTDNFELHSRDPEYDTPEFHDSYPMASTDYVVVPSDISTPLPTDTPTPTPTDTPTPTPTDTPTPTPTDTPTPTPTDTPTPTPTKKPTVTPTTKPTSTPTSGKQFDDVRDPKHPYYNAIYWAVDHGITKGYSGTNLFGIDDSCTRSQAMMFIWRMAGKPEPNMREQNPFSDITPSHAHYKAVIWAYQNGIAKGFSNGTYGVNQACSRGQIMTFIWRYANQPKPKSSVNPFKDSITPAFRTAILWGNEMGITRGYSDGTFRDGAPCTRGQIVTFLYRIRSWAYKGK